MICKNGCDQMNLKSIQHQICHRMFFFQIKLNVTAFIFLGVTKEENCLISTYQDCLEHVFNNGQDVTLFESMSL